MTKTVTFDFSNPSFQNPQAIGVSLRDGQESQQFDPSTVQKTMAEMNAIMGKYMARLKEQNKERYELLRKCPKFTASIDLPAVGGKYSVKILDGSDKWQITLPLTQETSSALDLQSLTQPRTVILLAPPPLIPDFDSSEETIILEVPKKEEKPAKTTAKMGLFSRFTSWLRPAASTQKPQVIPVTPAITTVLPEKTQTSSANPSVNIVAGIRPLPNEGKNICFINAIFQALMNAPEMIPVLIKAHELKKESERTSLQGLSATDDKFWPIFYSHQASTTLIEALKAYPQFDGDLNNLRGFKEGSIAGFKQEDACELLDKIFEPVIDLLEDPAGITPEELADLKKLVFKSEEVKQLKPFTPPAEKAEAYEKELAEKKNPSPLPENGILKKLQNSLIIRPELPDQKIQIQLQDLLKSQFTIQKPDEPSSYTDKGKRGWYQVTEKNLVIETFEKTAPQFITLQLIRFKDDKTKIDTKIELPKDNKVTLVIDGKNEQYEIQTLVLHRGTEIEGGHYFSYLRKERSWYEANDETDVVTQLIKLPPATGSEVYMIFLKKI